VTATDGADGPRPAFDHAVLGSDGMGRCRRHRVIRSDGSMGWFTGGAHIKRALLRLEGVNFPEQAALPL